MKAEIKRVRYDSGNVVCVAVVTNDKDQELVRSPEFVISIEEFEKLIKGL